MKRYCVLVLVALIAASGFGVAVEADAVKTVGRITIVSHIDIIPDAYVPQSEEKSAALFRTEMAATRKDKGLVSYVVLLQVDGNNHFTVVETWADSSAYAAHLGSEHTIAFRKGVQEFLGSPFDAREHREFR